MNKQLKEQNARATDLVTVLVAEYLFLSRLARIVDVQPAMHYNLLDRSAFLDYSYLTICGRRTSQSRQYSKRRDPLSSQRYSTRKAIPRSASAV